MDFESKIIKSPVVLITDEQGYHLENGDTLVNQDFEKKEKYEIVSI